MILQLCLKYDHVTIFILLDLLWWGPSSKTKTKVVKIKQKMHSLGDLFCIFGRYHCIDLGMKLWS